ncbi:MAG: glycosyltransferase [Anaerolineae bacterium]|jgi:glycosyltransferase involved in cell wall biosynthesis|nr:glycosyltransferase [Anaerolineae bacterium]MBT7074124.1 glycosyltransferase [Anaerolineae bacterium]MBT7781347.1 glycosyltransferase [Anaerolineae bacterium]
MRNKNGTNVTQGLPLVSIITPSFNQAPFIAATIDSVLAQDYSNLEYIVVDGGSTDGSIEIIKSYADKLACWVSEKDKGQTDAINKGFARANGQILAWLNSDDTYEPGAISAGVAFLMKNPDVGLVYGDCNFIDENGQKFGKFNAAQTDFKKLQQGYVHIPQQASFWRADLWKEVAPLDDSFYFAMDYDLWVRLARITEVKYLPGRNWANFRLHNDAKSIAADDRCWPEMMRVHYRDGGSFFSVMNAKYIIRKMIAPWWNWRRRRKMEKSRKSIRE